MLTGRLTIQVNFAGRGHEVVKRILRVNPAFNGMSFLHQARLFKPEFLSVGNADLLFYQVNAGSQFSYRMLHLYAGIHLQEIIIEVLIHQEFNGSCAVIADG
jgi:hypothetical protein